MNVISSFPRINCVSCEICRLVEELDKLTDVRASGMHGFYANLLSKNVSMGSDVSHAVSAYTAGSNRQSTLLEQQDDAVAGGAASSSNNNGNNIARKQSDKDSVVVEESSSASVSDPLEDEGGVGGGGTKRPRENDSGAVEDGSIVVSPAVEPVVVDKESKILSARERYLARKKQA